MNRPRGARAVSLAVGLAAIPAGTGAALASQGPGATLGSAEPITQATAAAMALFPAVAVSVFALARALNGGRS